MLKTGGADSRAVQKLQQNYSAAEIQKFVLLHEAAALFRTGSYFAEPNSYSCSELRSLGQGGMALSCPGRLLLTWQPLGPSLEAAVGTGCSEWVSWAPAACVASCRRAQGQNVVSAGPLDVKIIRWL